MAYYEKIYGYDIVETKANEIKLKSQQISDECIDHDRQLANSLIDRVFLKPQQLMNSTCLKLQFQGTRATKLFMGKFKWLISLTLTFSSETNSRTSR